MNNDAAENSTLKRSLEDLDIETADLQSTKRIADVKTMPKHTENQPLLNQPPINQMFSPVGKTTLEVKITPPTSDSTPIGNQQHSNNVIADHFTIPIANSFEPLANDNINNNLAHNKQKLQSNQKNVIIPPITVVGATNFSNALKILNNSIANAKYTIKYMSIGTKIMVKDSDTYTKLKGLLNAADVEFFSHDLRSEKVDKFVLSGIAKMPIKDIEETLRSYQLEPLEIREIDQKTRKFDNEGIYVVFFKHGSTKLPNLNKIKINYTIPKWRLFHTSKNNITQCRRCQLHGHGMRNCNLTPKCSNCGLEHRSETCNCPIQKCANCKGDHQSTSQECPKRKEFVQMRSRLAAANNKTTKPTPAPRMSLADFPKLTKSSKTTSKEIHLQNEPSTTQWSHILKNNQQIPERHNGKDTAKFSVEEIGPIMKDLLTGLKVCRNKEEQLIVMFEMATKWIYNNVP